MTSGAESSSELSQFRGAFAPGTAVGEYTIVGPLGSGGMAEVYAAVHPIIHKRAAVKVIRPELCANAEAVERFVREARAANAIGHPNIVDVFAFGTMPDGRPYFTMEKLEGENLAERLERGNIAFSHAAFVVDEIIDGLMAAHAAGVVHRDLKPENVFLVPEGGARVRVKLLDFGIAKLAHTEVRATVPNSILGTPLYLSPEQARGGDVDERADIYSLGCLCYELFLGELPFPSGAAMEIVAKHLNETAPAPETLWPGIPKKLSRILSAMVAKEPDDRPTLEALRRTLAELRESAIAGHVPGLDDLQAPCVARRRPAKAGFVAAAVVAAAGITFAAGLIPGFGNDGGHASDAAAAATPWVVSATEGASEPAPKPEPDVAMLPEADTEAGADTEPEADMQAEADAEAEADTEAEDSAPVAEPEANATPTRRERMAERRRKRRERKRREEKIGRAATNKAEPAAADVEPAVKAVPPPTPAPKKAEPTAPRSEGAETDQPAKPASDSRDDTVDPFTRDRTVDPF